MFIIKEYQEAVSTISKIPNNIIINIKGELR